MVSVSKTAYSLFFPLFPFSFLSFFVPLPTVYKCNMYMTGVGVTYKTGNSNFGAQKVTKTLGVLDILYNTHTHM